MKLEAYLTQKKLTAAAFGEKAGLSQSQVSRIMRGKSWPSREAVDAIFKATGGKVTAHDLYQTEAAE